MRRTSLSPVTRLRRRGLPVLVVCTALVLAGCGGEDGAQPGAAATGGSATSSAEDCSKESLDTLTAGRFTMATSEPAYEPWMVGDDPTNGQGFESAVAYAVTGELGYGKDEVTWVRVPFDAAVQPGPKTFDADINQFSITPERRRAVDFSSPYYDVRQAVVTLEGSPAAGAADLAALEGVRLGAQVGTTSLQAITDSIRPSSEPQVFNSNDDAKLALSNGQIDALVVDLPTAFYLVSAELDGGVVVGQLPQGSETPEQFGLLLDLDSPLTGCVSQAVDRLREDGTLDALEEEWLADVAGARELS